MRYRNIASPRTMINIGYPVFFVLAFILIVLIISGKFFWLAIILPIAAISHFVLMIKYISILQSVRDRK